MAGLGQGLGIAESLMNTANQGIGSLLNIGSQAMGNMILGQQIPKTQERMAGIISQGDRRNAETGNRATTNMRNNTAAGNAWNQRDANGDAVTDQGREYAGFRQKAGQDAMRLDQDQQQVQRGLQANLEYSQGIANELTALGRQQITDIMSASASAQTAFEGDRTATLMALKDDVASNMNSFRGANDNLISVGLQKAQEALKANGMSDDPLAILQAEAQVKGQYADQLGRQMSQLQSNYSQRLSETHLGLTAERTKLFDSISSQKNAAFSTAGENINKAGGTMSRARELEAGTLEKMSAFRADFADKQSVHNVEAYKAFANDAREAAQAANIVDQWAAQFEAQATAQTAANELGAAQLEFQGMAALAGHVIDTTWSVPQFNMTDSMLAFQMANQGGQDSGGSFSFGLPGIASYNS